MPTYRALELVNDLFEGFVECIGGLELGLCTCQWQFERGGAEMEGGVR